MTLSNDTTEKFGRKYAPRLPPSERTQSPVWVWAIPHLHLKKNTLCQCQLHCGLQQNRDPGGPLLILEASKEEHVDLVMQHTWLKYDM
jgi:hypothetical protein